MATGLAKIESLSAWMRPRVRTLLQLLELLGFTVSVYSGRRTRDEQAQLFKEGKTKTMQSRHLDGEAVDLIIAPSFGYRFAGLVWTSFGGTWGGNFKDAELAKVEFQHYEGPAV